MVAASLRRRIPAARAAGLGAVVCLTAACGVFPQQSPASAATSDRPTATAPGRASAAPPTSTPSASPPAPSNTATEPPTASVAWHVVGRRLAAPAAWLDFGFAGNGDLIALGTEDAAARPRHLFVATFSAAGHERSRHPLSRSLTPIDGDWAVVDPADGSVVIDDFAVSTGLFTLRAFDPTSGRNVRNVATDSGINRIAVTAAGRLYGLPQYGVDGNVWAAIVRLDGRGEVRSGVDFWLRPLDAGPRPPGDGVLQYPAAIAVGRDGRILVVDEPGVDAAFPDGTPRRTAVLTSLDASLGDPRQWQLPVEWQFGSAAFGTWVHLLAIAGGPDGGVYVGEAIIDEGSGLSAGRRVRVFDALGTLVETLGGAAATSPGGGPAGPGSPAIDAEGRLWVIDLDAATGTSSILVREEG